MLSSPIDVLWVLLCAGLVFVMQAGFLCLESGLTRSKNSINVAAKNMADFSVAALLFWLIGFGLMFGPSAGGWIGAGLFGFFDQMPDEPHLLGFVLLQVMFCATAANVVSGAVALHDRDADALLPAAERYGLMPRIDQWVVRNTLAWLSDRVRRDGDLDRVFAINLSGASLSDEQFRQHLQAQLETLQLPPGSLCFEITETAAVANLSKVVHFIGEVKRLGCLFALDDFGSGLSSFAYLKNLPVDFLKIDGSFIKDIESDPIDLAMVQAINTIGHVMGLRTIAEYVSSEAILARVRELGVDYAQGYQVGMPRPLDALAPVRRMPR